MHQTDKAPWFLISFLKQFHWKRFNYISICLTQPQSLFCRLNKYKPSFYETACYTKICLGPAPPRRNGLRENSTGFNNYLRERYLFSDQSALHLNKWTIPVSYTHLRAHETDSYLVCRL